MMQIPLADGEYLVNTYKVQPMVWSGNEWQGVGYWQQAAVTNRRLLFFPERHLESVDALEPSAILRAWNISLRGRDGLMMRMADGSHQYMLVEWSQGRRLAKDIQSLLAPAPRPRISPRLPIPA
ncbi:MAG TPA: hypothetical protein PLQ56_16030 [Aggregatilineales bacterium]|nr:hypothetical protein [Aggregatilineales bacterium]